jgi:hypothetical protein
VNLDIDLFFTFLVCMCRILIRARPLGPSIELGACSNSHPYTTSISTAAFSSSSSLALWHSRLGHASTSRVQLLASKGLLGSVFNSPFDCISCQLGKQPALSFNNSKSHATASFDLIHSNVWGPFPVASMSGSRYFVVFFDDFSRYTWVFLMKSRSELLDIYRTFAKMVETQFSKPIKAFHSDNALEYT